MSPVRLRTIAAKLGCSRTTVSYALRNQPCISLGMRKKVQRLAQKLGWRPNAELSRHLTLVRACGKRDLPNLAVVLNKPQCQLAEEHSPRRQLAGVTRRARELGYNLDCFNLAESPLSAARLLNVLQARGTQGIVFLATTGPGTELGVAHLEIGRHFATAVVGVRYPDPAYHVALTDLHASCHTVITELQRAGFRRPGAVLPRGLDATLAWAFGGGLQAGGFTLRPADRIPICHVGRDETHLPPYSFPEIAAWIREERPDVLVTTDTLYLQRCLTELGPPTAKLRICSLSYVDGITQDFGLDELSEEVGAAAVDIVVAQLHRGESGIPAIQRTVQVEGKWVRRAPAQRSAAGPGKENGRRKPVRLPSGIGVESV